MAEPVVTPEPEPKVEPVVQPVPAVEPKVAAAPEPVKPAPTVEPAKPDWREDRINKLTAQLRSTERERDELKKVAPETQATKQAEFDRRVDEVATQKAAQQVFDQQCRDVTTAGRSAFADFDGTVGQVLRLVDKNDQQSVQNYNQLLLATMETGKSHELLYALGKDLNEAARLLALPPAKMGVAVARMAGSTGEAEPSKVAKAIPAGVSRGAAVAQPETIDPADVTRADKLSTAEWMKRRNAQIQPERNTRH